MSKRKDDCLTICLAELLNIHYDEVPYFMKAKYASNWMYHLKVWAVKRGFRCVVDMDSTLRSDHMIAVGPSPKHTGNTHAVIVDRQLKVVYDPTYRLHKSIKSINYLLVFSKLET